ncbi:TonB-dependent receptor [Hyphomonas sp.]|uniref:TonB-dependent receptor domain-containing protein n=1 Tax=Hyphomonas sp. TaxID=87 RepID=UPI001D53B252|nr:TonB-dependent receptor [Hyphomonas sp.]MBU3920396.1 TonB-dependent receptor [Alphaproteobacteria bacterium]MBU4063769.1 TonB-dependent receptor [Alphaproteobacteria bacterium]MBU4164270.1 TonB-dependent receptor [Alphaproteobacteria bacterium]
MTRSSLSSHSKLKRAISKSRCMRADRLVAACIAFGALAPYSAAQAESVLFELPSEPLAQALISFAVQARVSISIPRDDLPAGMKSAPVSGRMNSKDALIALLQGTGLSVEEVNATTFKLVNFPAAGETDPIFAVPTQIHLPQAPPDSFEMDTIDRLAPVIVTAVRHPAALIDLPYSVSQVDNSRIERIGARTADDIGFETVGLLTTNVGPGRNKIILRGLSDGALTGQAKSNVGVYLDDTRLTFAAPDPALELVDIAAVEVLRGPQGTMYGAGSLGGIFRMVTNAPDLNFAYGSIQAGVSTVGQSNLTGRSLEGVVNLPLVADRLAVRAVAYTRKSAGWLDNLSIGESNTNSTLKVGGRLAVEARLGNSWTARLTGVGQNIDTEDAQYVDSLLDETVRTAHLLEPHDNKFLMSSFALRGATPFGELEASLSALGHRMDDEVDATGALTSLGVDPSAVAVDRKQDDIRILDQDIRLRGVAGRFPWSVGIFASEVEKDSTSRVSKIEDGTDIYASRRREEVYEYAIYGDVTWPVATWLDVSVGGRAFIIDTTAHIQRFEPLLGISDDTTRGVRDEGLAPRLSFTVQASPDVMVFASASEGYRPGGLNATGRVFSDAHARYAADELWNYELGIKAALANDHVRVRAATFAQTWENVQTDQLLDNGFVFTGNVGNARNLGFEAEAQVLDVLNSDLVLNVTTIDPEIVTPSASLPVASDALPGAPHIIVGGSISNDWGQLFGFGIRSHVAGQFIGQANSSFLGSAATATDDYSVLNVSLQARRDAWAIDLYADNILDAEASTFAYSNLVRPGASANVTPLTPIEIGLRLKHSF